MMKRLKIKIAKTVLRAITFACGGGGGGGCGC